MLAENLKQVEENIAAACERAGRKREEVTLIAVSKTKPISMLSEIYDCGIRDFGENKVQELCEKREQLPLDIRWHMIGHLQRNKVKFIIRDTALIHSVDTYRLAEEINIQAKKMKRIVPILIEVNIAKEPSNFARRSAAFNRRDFKIGQFADRRTNDNRPIHRKSRRKQAVFPANKKFIC